MHAVGAAERSRNAGLSHPATFDTAKRRLLLLSNSRDSEKRFLHHARDAVAASLAGVRTVTFVPYAAVTSTFDAYLQMVAEAFRRMGVQTQSVHTSVNPREMIANAEAIVIGGGNTFHLLEHLERDDIVDAIRERALSGVPYIGWSAGSVVACPTMQTTNDMPIVEPASFAALGLVRFQINAHFTDEHPPGFQGETRRQRLAEFIAANRDVSVVGLPEGAWLHVTGASVVLQGEHDAAVFRSGQDDMWATRGIELGAELERW
jgi:dipeptidase E